MKSLQKITSMIVNPLGYLNEVKNQPLKDDILFFIKLMILGGLIFLLATAVKIIYTGGSGNLNPVTISVISITILVMFFIDGLFFLLIISLIEHFFVLFTDGLQDFEKTMKSVIFASVLPVLFFWIPSVFQALYSTLILLAAFMIFTFYGCCTFLEKTKDRATFIAVFTTGIIFIALVHFGKMNFLGGLIG